MKRTILLAVTAIVALMAASCQKEEMGRVLTATIEQYEHNSKAYINDEYYACWESGDAVSINGTTYTINIENTTATIAAPTSDNLMAFYPANGVTDLTSTGGTVTLQHIQTYKESNGHQVIDNPMAAYSPEGSTELRFRNLCALLKVTIVGNISVKAIQVKGSDNQMLWGEAQLMLNNQGLPMLTDFTNGTNSVTLTFTNAVTINGSKSFYIVVPAASNFNQLTIAVLTTNGAHSKTSSIGQSLLRNQIGAISYTPNGDEDATFTPDWMIRYTGTAQVTPDIHIPTFKSAYLTDGNGYLLFEEPLTQIDDRAFYNCSSLISITLPASLTLIGGYAFDYCSNLSSISFPANLTTIGNYAFCNCSSLTSISLPQGVTSIGTYAFQSCSNLTSINLPASLNSIETSAFSSCSSLTSINLPASLTSIGNSAFYGCDKLSSISLPANLNLIDNAAFSGCSSLTSISLPASLTSIGHYAFENCSSLVRVDCHRETPPSLGETPFSGIPTASAVLHVPSGCAENYSGWDSHFPDANIVADL